MRFVNSLKLIPCLAALLSVSSAFALEIQNLEVTLNPSGNTPLAAICTFNTTEPAVPNVTFTDGLNATPIPSPDDYRTAHEILILGLQTDSAYVVSVEARNDKGETAAASAEPFATDSLPDLTPPIRVDNYQPNAMEPGYTFIPLMYWPEEGLRQDYGYLIAVDHNGNIVWYYRADHHVTEIRRAINGNILYQSGRAGHMYEIDMLGNILHHWYASGTSKPIQEGAIPVKTDTFHHDFFELPNENIVTLSSEARVLPDYPASETDLTVRKKNVAVIGDVIVEFTREGKIVRQHKTLDILDPYRIGIGSLSTDFHAAAYKNSPIQNGRDWLHTNSIFYDPSDDSVIMSSYHLDLIFKLDMKTGALKWILGNHEDWKDEYKPYLLEPKGDLLWPYHPHAAKITPTGTIILYDNGTHRGARPGKQPSSPIENFSRAVEFGVNAKTMQVEQLWHYGGPDGERFFSSFICDVDWLPQTGNILITDGGRTRTEEGTDGATPRSGQHWARILEVTHTTPSKKVWELTIDDKFPKGWSIYRSERLPSLYP